MLSSLPFLADAAQGLPGGWMLVVGVVLVLIGLGVPLFVIIGAVVFTSYAVAPEFTDPFGAGFGLNFDRTGDMVDLIETPDFVAIPFFMIAGAIMGRGLIARRLIDVATSWLGWLPGGLGVAAIFACVFFAAISGSSPVTVVTIGSVMVPALRNAGYTPSMSYGLVTAAGGLGIIIPPSIPMVVYAIYASNSGVSVKVEDLFMAGVIPGIVIALILSAFTMARGRKAERISFNFRRALLSIADGTWALFLPIFILGGIYTGLFSATQSAAMSVILAAVIEIWIHRSMKLSDLPKLISDNTVLLGALLLIIMLATGFSSFVEDREIPSALAQWLRDIDLAPLTFILIVNAILVLAGALLDIISAIVLFVPLLIPLAADLGFSPLHMGLIFIVNLEIGYLTPPIGLNLFVATSYFKQPFGLIVRAVAPFVAVMLVSLAIITFVPGLSTGLSNLSDGKDFWKPFPTRAALAARRAAETEAAPSEQDDASMQELMDDPEVMKIMREGGMLEDDAGATEAPAPVEPPGGVTDEEADEMRGDPSELDDEEEEEPSAPAGDVHGATGDVQGAGAPPDTTP